MAECPSNRQARRASVKLRRKAKKAQQRTEGRATATPTLTPKAAAEYEPPFPLPLGLHFRYRLFQSQFPVSKRLSKANQDTLIDQHQSTGKSLAHGIGHVLVPNPRYVDDDSTPRYAAFRLVNCLNKTQQAELQRNVELLEQSGLKSHTTSSHGGDFHQRWFGVWRRYSPHSCVTLDQRNKRAAPVINTLLKSLDANLATTAKYVRIIDEVTAVRMRYHHRNMGRYVTGAAAQNGSEDHARWLKAEGQDRQRTSAFRIGGMGTMLAVSSGETDYHYDKNDDNRHYSIIAVLGRGGILHLPELGYRIPVKSGDVVGLLAGQQLHRLEADPDDTQTSQVVLTIWTDHPTLTKIDKNIYQVEVSSEET